MGWCGSCFRILGFALVPLLAILAFFQLECMAEEKSGEAQVNKVFDPTTTDIVTPLAYCKLGKDVEMHIGVDYLLLSFTPCPILKVLGHLGLTTDKSSFAELSPDVHNVTILDARKQNLGGFHETGFTLVQLEEEPETKDWRKLIVNPRTKERDESADIKKFFDQMEPHIMELYPQTKRIRWTYNVVRGGDKLGDQPRAVGGPHMDYHQDNNERRAFHSKFPALPGSEGDLLMNQDDQIAVLLGVWKPIFPSTVCDFPLAVMDAATFDEEHQSKNHLHIDFLVFQFNNLNGAVAHHPKQRWAYYSFQSTKEVLLFHHFSRDKFFVNPHTSFPNTNCPKDHGSRVSVEIRVALYF